MTLPAPRSAWPPAIAEMTAVSAVALFACMALLRSLDLNFLPAAVIVCPAIGVLAGLRVGGALGPKGRLLPLFFLTALAAALFAVPRGDYRDALLAVSAFLLPPFALLGALAGEWLARRRARSSADPEPLNVYNQTASALIVAILVSSIVYDHAASLLPAAEAAVPIPRWLANALTAWFFVCLFAAYGWVRPIHLTASRGREDLRETARRRAERMYPFLIAIAAALELPPLLAKSVYGWFATGESPLRLLFPSLLGAYYTGYLLILYFEPYLFSAVMPRLYPGQDRFTPKRGATLSVRLKLWLMVLNLVLIPMALVLATLLQRREALGALWPTPAAIIIVAIACVVGYCEVLYGSVTKPLDELARKMQLVSDGNLSVRTTILGDDEIGRIKAHFNDMVRGLEERERLRDTFGRYVSVEIARKLIDDRRIDLGGESIEATILFSDIRNFTPMSERMEPAALVDFLNAYFSHVTEPVMEHRGVINKFIGDAVMAVFAPQFGSENHSDDAVSAALGMREALDAFNASRPDEAPVEFGVGIHTGILIAGNIGTKTRLEYTLIGDTVNVASRIESSNKDLGSTILVSQAVRDALSPARLEALKLERCDAVRLKGKSEATTLFKVL